MNGRTIHRRTLLTIALLVTLLVAAPASLAGNHNPGVLPPQTHAFGKSYGEWGAAWWAWALEQPASVNPVIDPTGVHCAQGQHGKVWFLAGTFGGDAERSCAIPTGKSIFFPLLNGWADNFTPEGGATTFTEEDLAAGCEGFIDGAGGAGALIASIDGRAVRDLADYRIKPTLFQYAVPAGDDSVFDYLGYSAIEGEVPPPGGVACGYYLLLAPLPKGEYELRFAAEGFLEVTYHLTVAKHS